MLSTLRIPLYVCLIASFGPKFNYYECAAERNDIFKYLIVFEKLKDLVMDFASMNVLNREKEKFLKRCERGKFRERTAVPSKAHMFIRLQMERTKKFLHTNPGIRIFPADKGGKVVVTDHQVYVEKMRMYLHVNVKTGIYFKCQGFTVEHVKKIWEEKYDRVRQMVNGYFENDFKLGFKNVSERLGCEPFVMSRIYGLFKVHKDGFPVRPIVSATNCASKELEKWMREKLTIIAKRIGRHQIRNANELFEKLDGKKLNGTNHVLVTFDFDSMFTNIPFQTTKGIIEKLYYLIEDETSMPVNVFIEALSFIIEESPFFTFEGEVYLQSEGLAMGNSLSQVLAEITTSYLMNEALAGFGKEISFIFKYVDDLIGAMDENILEAVKLAIEETHNGMGLKLVAENDSQEVDYLQMKVGRDATSGNTIYFKWSQKEFGAKRILDFHSFHPLKMKENIVREYIRTALRLTSVSYLNESINILKKTLFNSNYPYYFVWNQIGIVKSELGKDSEMIVNKRNRIRSKFIPCPYRPGSIRVVRKIIKKSNVRNVSVTPTMNHSNAKTVFANLKDNRNLMNLVRSSFIVRCTDCEFTDTLFTGVSDVGKTLDTALSNVDSKVYKHCIDSGHSMNEDVRIKDVTQYKSRIDMSFAKRNI